MRDVLRGWLSSARGQLFGCGCCSRFRLAGPRTSSGSSIRRRPRARWPRARSSQRGPAFAINDRFRFYTTGWTAKSSQPDAQTLQKDLTAVISSALSRFPSVEGGIWAKSDGSLAYAYPTYEGSGPKTDVPAAELRPFKR